MFRSVFLICIITASFYLVAEKFVNTNGVANEKTFSDFLKNADDENITSFFKSVQVVINNINIENTGYRLITNSGEDGGQEVPHFHIHILAGEKIGGLR